MFTPLTSFPATMIEWDANAEPDIAGYRVYFGLQSRQYESVVDVGLATQMLIPALEPGRLFYFAVTAYNTDGLESDFSDEVNCTRPVDGTNAFLVPLSIKFASATSAVPISFVGQTGKQYFVQATEDFQSWQTIHNVAVQANGICEWLDADAPNHSKRFYRVIGSQQ